jgi:hypothetical protein
MAGRIKQRSGTSAHDTRQASLTDMSGPAFAIKQSLRQINWPPFHFA